jgi:hypothetical protein
MKRTFSFLSLSIILISGFFSFSCTKIDYVGKSYAPTSDVDIFFSMDDIRGEYEVMGHLTATAGDFVSTEKMQEDILEKAREKGADAVVILGLGHYVVDTGSSWSETTETSKTSGGVKTTTSGSQSSGTEEKKEITAQFIKYIRSGG